VWQTQSAQLSPAALGSPARKRLEVQALQGTYQEEFGHSTEAVIPALPQK